MTMEYWQLNVKEEKRQLDDKVYRLDKFVNGAPGSSFMGLVPAEQRRLVAQLYTMQQYSNILAARIKAWDDPLPTNTLPEAPKPGPAPGT
jgi:hypothetical protein